MPMHASSSTSSATHSYRLLVLGCLKVETGKDLGVIKP
jgi:hypothetical protein